jgi:transposase
MINTKDKDGHVSAKNKVKMGIDAHLNNFSVCVIEENGNPKPAQKFNEVGLLKWVAKHCVEGVEVYTCYEAGPMGFELHRKLEALGVKNVVVQPQNWDERGKGQKTDALDAKALATRLDRYVAGNKESFATVRIPSKEEQIKRDLSRHRESLKEQTKRIAAKGGSLLRYHGYLTDNGWWKKNTWAKFEQELEAGIVKILKNYREQILLLESQEKAVVEELESSEGAEEIKGLGNLSAESLSREVCDWNRFSNRREVVSFAGLCPRQHSSGKKVQMGSISKHGNPMIRCYAIELAWRFTRFQPQYTGTQKFRKLCGENPSSGQKKKAIVAMARQIMIDLWRIFTNKMTPDKVGLILKESK